MLIHPVAGQPSSRASALGFGWTLAMVSIGLGIFSVWGNYLAPNSLRTPAGVVLILIGAIVALGLGAIALVLARRRASRKVTILATVGILISLWTSAIGIWSVVVIRGMVAEVIERQEALAQLRALMIAQHAYHNLHQGLPPTARNGLSWRVYLLPFLGEQALYQQFRLNEPWNSEHNLSLIDKMPAAYRSTGRNKKLPPGKTCYLRPVGQGAAFRPEDDQVNLNSIPVGISNLFGLIEVDADQARIWTEPADYKFDSDDPTRGWASSSRGRLPPHFRGVFLDGKTWSAKTTSIDRSTLRMYFTGESTLRD